MSLDHAILGFLSYKPMSGYDLKAYFSESVRHFWPTTQSQIYRTLARMAEQGWIRLERVSQEDRPDRKVYHLTDRGEAELQRWLAEPLVPSPQREPWLIQVFFSHRLSDDQIAALFEARAARLRERLDVYQTSILPVIEERTRQVGSQRAGRGWRFTLEYGISSIEWELAWIEQALLQLQRLAPD